MNKSILILMAWLLVGLSIGYDFSNNHLNQNNVIAASSFTNGINNAQVREHDICFISVAKGYGQ